MSLWDSIKRLFGGGQPKAPRDGRASDLKPHAAARTGPAEGPARSFEIPTSAPANRRAVPVPPEQPEPPTRPVVRTRAPAMLVRAPLPDDLLQFSTVQAAQQAVDIVVGFDFGTSSSKVVLQTPYKLGSRAIPINFGSFGHPAMPFLLRSAIAEQADGRYSLVLASNACFVHRDLKVRLLGNDSGAAPVGLEDEHLSRAAAYVGLALREARRCFLNDKVEREHYKMDRLRWSMNLGIPSAGYDDAAIKGRFDLVARAGWLMSLSSSSPTAATACKTLRQARKEKGVGIAINVIPEVAAEVVGYAKSLQRRDGLHFILDVGASTMDLCAFVLHADRGDDIYELLAADVKPLGLLALHDARMQAAAGFPPFDSWPEDLTTSIPGWEGLADLPAVVKPRLKRADDDYVNTAARQMLLRMIDYVRHHRDPNSEGWRTGVPLFLCGGGGHHGTVPRLVSLADSTGRRNWTGYHGLKVRPLPLPSQLTGDVAPDVYQSRLSVAYGLSFPNINIGPINPPTSIPDVQSRDRFNGGRWKDRFIDKDQV